MKPDCSKCHAPELCCSQRIGLDMNEVYRLGYIGGANIQYDLRTGGGVLNPDGGQCKFHSEAKCGIYDNRPKVCAEWHCLDMEGWVARERQLKGRGNKWYSPPYFAQRKFQWHTYPRLVSGRRS
ncbi:MAG: hypothetical protein GY703_22715 [Gammaproteobacteria bacterium]|nr:hypothetical protein [Gammaproteobacteria bacterium]